VGSVDFANAKLDEHAKSAELFDVAKYPTATYVGKFTKWNGDKPTEAEGTFTLHGVSKPLTLKIDSFRCMQNPMTKKEVCGADATASFDRSDYGITFGQAYGFQMWVKLEIQVEGSPAT
jgi:polyisoprenoid-binding protein YceI